MSGIRNYRVPDMELTRTMPSKSGIAKGDNAGFKTTKLAKPSSRMIRGALIKRDDIIAVKKIIARVANLSTFEERVVNILEKGASNATKRAMRVLKLRLGSHKSAKSKYQKLEVVARQRAAERQRVLEEKRRIAEEQREREERARLEELAKQEAAANTTNEKK